MNLPFGLPALRENTSKRKDDSSEIAAYYERKLADYRDTLEKYKNCLFEYASRLDGYDKRSVDNQLSIVQTAIDLTYLKEQGDKVVDLIEEKVDKVGKLIEKQGDKVAESIEEQGVKVAESIETQGVKVYELSEEIKNQAADKSLASNMESIVASITDANEKLNGLDKNVVNRLSELLIELQKQSIYQNRQLQTDMAMDIEKITKSVKRGNALMWFLFILSLFSLSGIVFMGLYIMEIIPF